MLLFDIIRDWFVQYIWGGYTSTGVDYTGFLGNFGNSSEQIYYSGGTADMYIPIKVFSNGTDFSYDYMLIGDWLSTTSTIIVMILLCVVFGLMVRWLFRLTAGLLRGN